MRLAVLSEGPELRGTLRCLFSAGARTGTPPILRFLQSWPQLLRHGEAGQVDLALVDPRFGHRQGLDLISLDSLVATLGKRRIILCFGGGRLDPTTLNQLSKLGFPYLLVEGVDEVSRSLPRILARAHNRHALEATLDGSRQKPLPEEGKRLLLEGLATWPPPRGTHDLATRLAMGRRTLGRRFQDFSLPSPGRCIAWGRLLEANTLCCWGAGSKARIAALTGMGGSDTLAHLCRRLTGVSLGRVWAPETIWDPVEVFLKEVGRGGMSARRESDPKPAAVPHLRNSSNEAPSSRGPVATDLKDDSVLADPD